MMKQIERIWERAKLSLSQDNSISSVSMNLWISPLKLSHLDGESAVLIASSAFNRDVVIKQFINQLSSALEKELGFRIQISVLAEYEAPEIPVQKPDSQENDKTVIEQLYTENEYTFDNFVVGSSNKLVHAACQAVANDPAKAYNPLFIYGDSGLGKTHLLFAIQNEILKRKPDSTISYINSEDFTNELVKAISQNKMDDFKNRYRSIDVLLMDDIQFIGGKIQTQEEFFHTFNTLYKNTKQIVLASDRPPKEIQNLEDRIRSRFEGGLIVDIQAPDFELRMAIIKKKADALNIELSDNVVDFIANKIKNNIRQLEGVIKKIKAYYLLTGSVPNITVAQSAIRDILYENEPVAVTVDKIITEVGRYYNILPEDIKSKKRSSDITLARQVCMYIIREVTQLSLPSIGEEFGGRDHSTVHHSIFKIEDTIKKNSYFKQNINELIKNIRER